MSDVPRPLPPKKDVALALLEREPSVFIHLDPRRQGVAVPKWFAGQPQLILQVGLNMAIPIPDLRVDDEGISCTLSFNRAPFQCRLPWHAIWALVSEDQRGMVWPEDIPADLAAQKQRSAATGPQKPAKKASKPRLAAVESIRDDGESRAEALAPAEAEEDGERRAPTQLDEARARVARMRPLREAGEGGAAAAAERGESEGEGAAPVRQLSPVPALAAVQQVNEAVIEDEGGTSSEPAPGPRRGAGAKPKRELPPYLRVIK